MREISEFTLLGNYLLFVTEKLGQESIKFELAKSFTDKVLERVNKSGVNYQLLPLEPKMEIVKKMISKGVFRTDSSNAIKPFKQVYNYEVSKSILAFYACDGTLTFKFAKPANDNKDFYISSIKASYNNLNLDLKNAVDAVMHEHELKSKSKLKIK